MKNATNVIVLVLSVLLLAGCSQSPSGKATADIEKVTVLFGFSQNVGYSGFYMAQANGYYADEGLSVEFVYLTAGDTEAMKHLAAGNANFMYAGDQGAIMARQDGMGVQEIASIWPKSMFRIAYRDGAIPPFKGQKVLMVAPGSTTEAIVKLFLQQNGMGISDIEPIYAGGQLIPTFVSKQADVTSTFLPQQIITEVMGKEKLSTIKASQFTTLGSVGIYATEDYLAKNSRIAQRFVRATLKGMKEAVANPGEAVDAFVQLNPEAQAQKEMNLRIWNAMEEECFPTGWKLQLPSQERWEEKLAQMRSLGLVNADINAKSLYTDRFN